MKVVVTKENNIQYEASILDDDLINGGELFIGRDDDCHVVLKSQKISRHHAIISYEDNRMVIKTLSNFGNLKVDGRDVEIGVVQNGSKVEIDDYLIQFTEFSAITASPEISTSIPEETINEPILANVEELDISEDLLDIEEESIGEENEFSEQLGIEDELVNDEFDEDPLSNGDLQELGDTEALDYDDNSVESLEELTETEAVETLENENTFHDDNVEFPIHHDEEQMDENLSEDNEDTLEEDQFDDEFASGVNEDDFDSGFDEEATQVVSSFASYYLKIFGEYAPFDSYKLEDPVTKIGRDTAECKIILNDPEVSKIHAIIKKNIVSCMIEDNGSSNGIILNGERVNKAELTNGDEFIIGETTFTVVISSDILESEKGRLMPVEDNQEIII